MILTFKPQFVEPIKAGTKIHTIREDKKGRWKPGMKIHFWNGNPRNVKANPHQFQSGICTDVKDIVLGLFVHEFVLIVSNEPTIYFEDEESLNEFAVNDGFENWNELKKWFKLNHDVQERFSGKLIYFKVHATLKPH